MTESPSLPPFEIDAFPIKVTVVTVTARHLVGVLETFAPEDPVWVVHVETQRPGGERYAVPTSLPRDQVSYVAFHKCDQGDVRVQHDPVGLQLVEVHLPGGATLPALCGRDAVQHPIGFWGHPTSQLSLYAWVFFVQAGINLVEVRKPLGQILVERGSLSSGDVDRGLVAQSLQRHTPLGQILVDRKLLSERDLDDAIQKQRMMQRHGKRLRIGEILVQAGVATDADIQRALEEQKRHRGRRLGQVLIDLGVVTELDVAHALADKFHLPFVDLDEVELMPEAIAALPVALMGRYEVLPFWTDEQSIQVAMGDPLAMEAIDMMRFSLPKRIDEVVVLPSQLERYLKEIVGVDRDSPGGAEGMDDLLHELEAEGPQAAIKSDVHMAEEDSSAVAKLVNKIILDAYRRGVSDIHVEPNGMEQPAVISFRTDGVCEVAHRIPGPYWPQLVARIKIIANLDITERRKPQDGKIKFRVGKNDIELRVATIPTAGRNEDVVMRILAAGEPLTLAQLELGAWNLQALERAIRQPYGLILAVGPTGSGKTTTLHSLLGAINTPARKIWTAEDPVEITQAGLRQVQVAPRIGFTFAAAMRAFLRADPDVIMVGEMRDQETAHTGVEASLTGHLVFSTLHTNNAPETITRLIDMGLDPFSFSDALLAIAAQRLARRLCSRCVEPYEATAPELASLVELVGEEELEPFRADGPLRLYRGRGCSTCRGSGYKGRLGLHEVLVNDDTLRHAIQAHGKVEELRRIAVAAGMRTLLQDGVTKCLQGKTDLVQVLAVCSR